MARRTFTDYQAAVVHALGGEPSTGLSKTEVVNDALMHLAAMHPWNWRRGGPVVISMTGPISFTMDTWTEGTKTLTSGTSLFANYTVAAGDYVTISGGTGVTPGKYVVVSKTSTTLVLATSISTAGVDLATPNITGSISFPYVALPSDFGEEYSVTYPGTFTSRMIRTTLSDIERMRSLPIVSAFWGYFFAVNTGQSTTSNLGLDTPRLEIYPAPTVALPNAISLTYLRNTARLTNGTDVPQIPAWMDYSFDMLCRAFAHAVEDDDPNSAAQQQFDRMLPSLRERDGSSQRRLGVMSGGLYPKSTGIDPLYPRSIGDPMFAQSP